MLATMCLHINRKTHKTCDLNFIVKGEKLIKVTGSHVQCKNSNISETVLDRDVVTTGHYKQVICGLSNSSNCDDLECP